MNYLGQLSHPHLVKLIGYCLEEENKILVYEFMPRGTLENHLFISEFLPSSSFHIVILDKACLTLPTML